MTGISIETDHKGSAMTEFWEQVLTAVTSGASVVGLTAFCTWLIKSYRQFRRTTESTERMAVSLESMNRKIGEFDGRLSQVIATVERNEKRITALENRTN